LEVQINAQIEANTRFGNFKGANIFKVAKEIIKQMKRLQNPGMVNGKPLTPDEKPSNTSCSNNPSSLKIKNVIHG
jgi:hypothetical protein